MTVKITPKIPEFLNYNKPKFFLYNLSNINTSFLNMVNLS